MFIAPKKIWNPLEKIYRDLNIAGTSRWQYDQHNLLINDPHTYSDNFNFAMKSRQRYTYAVPSLKIVEEIAKIAENGSVVEIGAGLGYWAKYLSQFNLQIIAYDLKYDERNIYFDNDAQEFFPVKQGGVSSIALHHDSPLLLCWPPYNTPFAFDALSLYKGDYLIYIGESEGGCTGDQQFFNLLNEEWEEIFYNSEVLNLVGIHSAEYIYKRKTSIPLSERFLALPEKGDVSSDELY